MRLQPFVETPAHMLRLRAVESDQRDRLMPCRKLLRNGTVAIDDERCAIEHQLVLTADPVDVDDRQAGLAGAGAHLRKTECLLMSVIRRPVRHDDQLGAGRFRERRRGGEPDVLADDRRAPDAVDVEDAGFAVRREITLLVEHGVIRKHRFPIHLRDRTVPNDCHGVVAHAFAKLRKAHQRRHAAHTGRKRA